MAKRNDGTPNSITLQARLGATIRRARKELGITQEELAWRADMHRTYIADIERGGRNITLQSIANLAEALQIPIDRLLSRARSGGPADLAGENVTDVIGEILLAEDSATDAELTLRAFRRAKFTNPIKVVRDGEEAIDYLFGAGRQGRKKSAALPQLVLLDLNLPKISGLDVLRRIKANEETRTIPVVVLTVSQQDQDIIECGRLGAENYIIKPVSFDNFCKVTPKLSLRWALLNPASEQG